VSKTPPALVNPSMLKWARHERGITINQAAKSIGVEVSKLEEVESGKTHLSFAQFRKAAWIYRRPTAIFYLRQTPPSLKIPAFRRVTKHKSRPLSPELRLAIRGIYQKRESAIELREFSPDFNWDYVGSVSLEDDPEKVGQKIRDMFNISESFHVGVRDHQAFNTWRRAIEKTGTLIFLISGVDVGEMRGFAIAKKPFPIIAANRKDEIRPRCFTLLHEFSHILLGDSSLCEISHAHRAQDKNHEKFCNHVAGAALVPANLLLSNPIVKFHSTSDVWSDKELQDLASGFKVSKDVILRRLLTLDHTTSEFYGSKHTQWSGRTPPERTGSPRESIPEKVLRTDGITYTSIVLKAVHKEAITAADASELLGMNLKHLSALEDLISKQE
jgi:Zn-dependent peptidase ImmA (M78 family)